MTRAHAALPCACEDGSHRQRRAVHRATPGNRPGEVPRAAPAGQRVPAADRPAARRRDPRADGADLGALLGTDPRRVAVGRLAGAVPHRQPRRRAARRLRGPAGRPVRRPDGAQAARPAVDPRAARGGHRPARRGDRPRLRDHRRDRRDAVHRLAAAHRRARGLAGPDRLTGAPTVGIRDYYRQFEAVPAEEVNRGLREEAQERRRSALSRVEPLDLSVTTWPEYPPSRVVDAITYAARRGLHRYQERQGGELRGELAHALGLEPERVVVGDGSAQLMTAAAHALLAPGDELVTPWPGYPLHPIVARAAQGVAVPVPGFSVDALLRAVNERTRIVALANPNDPTGELLRRGELARLLTALPERVVVVLDEALRDYVTAEERDAALHLTAEHPRLLVFRTFSKAWGLAGLRCGYAVGGPDAAALLEQLEPSLGLGDLAVAGVLEAVRHHAGLPAQRAAVITAQRARLLEAVAGLPLTVTPSQANVLWIGARGHGGGDLAEHLQRAGIAVRSGGPLGDPARIRLTVPHRPQDVERVARALETAVA
ncbi:hypothetical protein C7Y72_21695 [Paraconexibacter algicola]|uniref:Aminotransferase class I/classII large domain-containing protein n=1 Tax=Paraconexibacter algicola TaxID=2133960 RepID=A0A2T4UC09_9ACTN|nr:hypothetical protein C7Y72_21695 [Paraconexibacter algicola]